DSSSRRDPFSDRTTHPFRPAPNSECTSTVLYVPPCSPCEGFVGKPCLSNIQPKTTHARAVVHLSTVARANALVRYSAPERRPAKAASEPDQYLAQLRRVQSLA